MSDKKSVQRAREGIYDRCLRTEANYESMTHMKWLQLS